MKRRIWGKGGGGLLYETCTVVGPAPSHRIAGFCFVWGLQYVLYITPYVQYKLQLGVLAVRLGEL